MAKSVFLLWLLGCTSGEPSETDAVSDSDLDSDSVDTDVEVDPLLVSGIHWTAESNDGSDFTHTGDILYQFDASTYFTGNPEVMSDGVRMYLFSPAGGPIRSMFATDGETFIEEETIHLSLDEESGFEREYVGEPDVVRTSDGGYLMIYSTLIPE